MYKSKLQDGSLCYSPQTWRVRSRLFDFGLCVFSGAVLTLVLIGVLPVLGAL